MLISKEVLYYLNDLKSVCLTKFRGIRTYHYITLSKICSKLSFKDFLYLNKELTVLLLKFQCVGAARGNLRLTTSSSTAKEKKLENYCELAKNI